MATVTAFLAPCCCALARCARLRLAHCALQRMAVLFLRCCHLAEPATATSPPCLQAMGRRAAAVALLRGVVPASAPWAPRCVLASLPGPSKPLRMPMCAHVVLLLRPRLTALLYAHSCAELLRPAPLPRPHGRPVGRCHGAMVMRSLTVQRAKGQPRQD